MFAAELSDDRLTGGPVATGFFGCLGIKKGTAPLVLLANVAVPTLAVRPGAAGELADRLESSLPGALRTLDPWLWSTAFLLMGVLTISSGGGGLSELFVRQAVDGAPVRLLV